MSETDYQVLPGAGLGFKPFLNNQNNNDLIPETALIQEEADSFPFQFLVAFTVKG